MTSPITRLTSATRDDIYVKVIFFENTFINTKTLLLSNRDVERRSSTPSLLDLSMKDLGKVVLSKLSLDSTQATISIKFHKSVIRTTIRELREKSSPDEAGTSEYGNHLEAVVLKRFVS